MSIKIKQRKPYLVKEVGEWKFTFHYKEGSIEKTFLSIVSKNGLMNMRIGGNSDAYGYLIAAAMQGRDDQLQGFAMTMFVPAMTITQDKELNEDVQKAILRYFDRRDRKGEKRAAQVTEEQETAAQAYMEDVAEFADAKSDKERKAIRERWKQELKEEIRNGEGEENDIQGD